MAVTVAPTSGAAVSLASSLPVATIVMPSYRFNTYVGVGGADGTFPTTKFGWAVLACGSTTPPRFAVLALLIVIVHEPGDNSPNEAMPSLAVTTVTVLAPFVAVMVTISSAPPSVDSTVGLTVRGTAIRVAVRNWVDLPATSRGRVTVS